VFLRVSLSPWPRVHRSFVGEQFDAKCHRGDKHRKFLKGACPDGDIVRTKGEVSWGGGKLV